MLRSVFYTFFGLVVTSLPSTGDAAEVVGNVPTQLNVQQGNAAYKIPIPLPDGFGYGLMPELVLSYDSSRGNGAVGLGWNIDVPGSIVRCRQTVAQDGRVLGVSYTSSDRFCLDGARLVSASGSYGSNGATYYTEVDSLRRITSYGTKASGPDYFKVETTDRETYYGKTGDSSMKGVSQPGTYEWLVTSMSAYNDASIHFTYLTGKDYPYLSKISSGGMEVRFGYENRPDVRSEYFNGHILRKISMRLKTIETLVGGNLHRKIYITYSSSGESKMSVLNKVKVCSGSGNCLKPVEMSYKGLNDVKQTTTPGYWINAFGASSGGWSTGNHPRHVVDVNGDGLADIVGFANAGVYVALNTGNNKFSPGKYWVRSFGQSAGGWRVASHPRFVVDVNGDNLPDIVGFANAGVYVALNTAGESFASPKLWVADFGYSQGWRINMHPRFMKDVNGDGLIDVVGFGSGGVYVSLNTGSSFKTPALWLNGQFSYSGGGWRVERHPRFVEDVNGDGLPDIVGFANAGVYVGLNTGRSFASGSLWLRQFGYTAGGWGVRSHPRYVTDINGDGLADIVGFANAGVYVSIGTGKSFLTAKLWVKDYGYSAGGWRVESHPRYLSDMNGDGLPDVVGFANAGAYISLNTGSSFGTPSYWVSQYGASTGGWRVSAHPRMLVDVNGDGLTDIVGFANSGVYISLNKNEVKVLTGVTDSLGNKDTITYTTQADKTVYKSTKKVNTYPNAQFNNAQQLVKRIDNDNGIGGQNVTDFTYGPLFINMKGRGILGYEWVEAKLPQSNEVRRDVYNLIYPLTRTVAKSTINVNGKVVSEKSQTFSHRQNPQAGANNIQIVLDKIIQKVNEIDGTPIKVETEEFKNIDEYGNARDITRTISGGGVTFKQETNRSFLNNKQKWFIGQVLCLKVTHTDQHGKKAVRQTMRSYDVTKRTIASMVIEPDDNLALVTNNIYDKFGNMIKQTRTPKFTHGNQAKQIRSVTTAYDSNGVRKVSTTNSLGHTETYQYDRLGNTIAMVGANGLKTSWTYDDFGRKLSERRPDGSQINWSYQWDNTIPHAGYKVSTSEPGKPSGRRIYDKLDRVIRIHTKDFNGKDVYEDITYSGLGHVAKQSLPYKSTCRPSWVQYTYDVIGREVKVDRPMDSNLRHVTRKVFKGLITESFDGKGHKTTTQRDVMDRMIKVIDANGGELNYQYDAVGNLKKITDPAGNADEFIYDKVGNKIQMTDPDMGTWKYGYNAFGELVRQTDAKGQEKLEYFDELGRIVKRNEPEGDTLWFYDTKPRGKGKVAKVTAPGGFTREYNYDSVGREFIVNTTIGSKVLEVKTSYNRQSQITQQTYPGGKTVHYCYSPTGYLIAVRKSACSGPLTDNYWTGLNYDQFGQVTKETSGNGILTEYQYDLMNHVTHIRSTDKSKRTLRHWQYGYNTDGNMLSRKDLISERKTIETFEYDNLDRVVRATMRSQNPADQRAFTEDWQYDAIGNIRRFSGMGGPHHVYHSQKPRALVQAGHNSYAYDDNGNVIRKNMQTVGWTSFNMPEKFETSSQVVNFKYDPDRSRYVKSTFDHHTENEKKTYYLGKVYEVTENDQGDEHKYFVYANNKLVGIETVINSNTNMRYVHLDHVGSVDTITGESGQVLLRKRYNVFGKPQPFKDWAFERSSVSYSAASFSGIKRDFTGQERIDELQLIHMNGRVYDPEVGRFLSPDPHVQDPYDTQSFNRYSYAKNNPLRYNDPSGFFFKKIGRFFKKVFTPRVIIAVVASAVTFGAATPWAAGLAVSAGLTGASAAVATGAIAGATAGFVGGTIATGSVKGGLQGALGGAITGGVGGYFGNSWNLERVAAQGVGAGAASELTGGRFKDGLVLGLVTSSMRYAYNKIVKYDVTWKPGGKAVTKEPWDMPVKGANNFGTAEETLDPSGWFNEGGRLSVVANRVPGINAVAGMHDVFQVRLDQVSLPFARDVFNVPGMLPAAAMTYTALLDGPASAALIVDQKRSKRVQ
ncbi:uncharacterized protein LOC141904717 [Tubulanus polymorphus]|uniref:uncharacterized protein LOC141904717 n=1 Tax=Tubulanus polymorphus TaxID=672921 RepID=UPI003DA282DB